MTDLPKKIFFVAMLGVALLQAFAYNTAAYSTDDCAYLDQAVLFAQFDFKQAVNTYWSPLYPFLLGMMLKVFQPPLAQQLMAVKLFNVAVLALTLTSFNFFFSRFYPYQKTVGVADGDADEVSAEANNATLSQTKWFTLAALLFSWTFLYVGGVQQATPDYLVSASLFFATGIAIDIWKRPSLQRFPLLGTVLSIGYLAKASMIPSMVILILLTAYKMPRIKDKLVSAAIAFLCVVLIALPYWTALSIKTGSLSIGSSAGLNYMLWVNPGYSLLGNNKPEVEKQLAHPMVSLSEKPDIVVFEDVLPATFPPWFDPGYFAQGLKTVFSPAGSALALVLNAVYLFCLFGWQLVAIILAGRLVAQKRSIKVAGWEKSLILWLPSVMTTIGICLVISLPSGFSTPRYFASTVVLVYLSYFALTKFPNDARGQRALNASFITACFISGAFLIYGINCDAMRLIRGRVDQPLNVALSLHEMGLNPGDKVVLIGKECGEWARIAGLRIAAIVVTDTSDQTTDDVTYVHWILEKLKAGTGAKAAVYFPDPISDNLVEEEALIKGYREFFTSVTGIKLASPPRRSKFNEESLREWKKVKGTECYVYLLH